MAEYAVVISGIAAVCVVAALFLGGVIANRVDNAKPSAPPSAPLEPPHTSPRLVWPTKLEECQNGGWKNYAQFNTEKQCTDYVDRLT
jgi:hypothetical protein